MTVMAYIKSAALEETGFVVLDSYNQEIDPKEWLDRVQRLEVLGRHPLRAAGLRQGRDRVQRLLEPQAPRTDKDGVWIDSQTPIADPHARAQEPGANVGAAAHHRAAAPNPTATASTTCTRTTTTV
jgi:hypothetical protein